MTATTATTIPATTATTSGQDALSFLGRALIALLFIPAGFSKIGGFAGVTGYIASKGLPMPAAGAALAIVVELLIGLMLLAGFKTRFSALVLAVFTVVASVVFHNFWALQGAQAMAQQQAFFKNIAVVGGLLVLMAFGPGGWSIDARGRKR
ncbi:DoxX family protein [Ramlibacter tataouinensis]|uniref:Candidate membrane protein n=1 Tax=Ramlibacter tataouinensis (strain ATCC BAA-407 / DSM 14655 / LMG 21543 / TTB310) TaxID=365046 RepID=F5Y4U3_RAMTT|nr:DoxX family protein [Ramlibacter tataouinensis]AEG92599.1 candidate membrane protein [Ramlibacter tataouinensis TTB310]